MNKNLLSELNEHFSLSSKYTSIPKRVSILPGDDPELEYQVRLHTYLLFLESKQICHTIIFISYYILYIYNI